MSMRNDSEAKAKARPWIAYDRGIGWEIHSGCNGDHTACISVNNNGFRGTMEEADVRLAISAVNAAPLAEELARAVLADLTIDAQIHELAERYLAAVEGK